MFIYTKEVFRCGKSKDSQYNDKIKQNDSRTKQRSTNTTQKNKD
jgi:hypothetical protein